MPENAYYVNRKHIVRTWLLSYKKYYEEADKRLLFTILNVLFKYCQKLLSLFSFHFIVCIDYTTSILSLYEYSIIKHAHICICCYIH